MLPIDSPYARQLLAEHLHLYARGKRDLRVHIGRQTWEVTTAANTGLVCCRCGRHVRDVALHSAARGVSCVPCAAR